MTLDSKRDSKLPLQNSLGDTTGVTANLSTYRISSGLHHQNQSVQLEDVNRSNDLAGVNIFNFAPQTQRGHETQDVMTTDQQHDSLNIPLDSSREERH